MPARKKSNSLKLLHGARNGTINRDVPKISGTATCPSYLSPLARREWKRIMAQIGHLGLVTPVDQSALAAYCEAWALWRTAADEVKATGITVKEPIVSRYTGEITGYRIKKSPSLTILQQERAATLAAGKLLGFDPTSRSGISLPGQQPSVEADDIDDYSFDVSENDDPAESVQ